jgi:uncharacterized protein DUF4430
LSAAEPVWYSRWLGDVVTASLRSVLVSLAATAALVAAGCTIGPDGSGSGGARLTVTRDFGSTTLLRATERSLPEGETVMRFLQRRARVETRYGGRFVDEINGVRSGNPNGRRRDWFYYVNGIEADIGAAEHEVHRGDRVWWDYRDWTTAMRVPAVVGSFPEPFIHGSNGKSFPVRIDCARGADETCNELADRLSRAGIIPNKTALGAPAGDALLRFVVGIWGDVRNDESARQIEGGPGESGVFARVAEVAGGYRFDLLDRDGAVVKSLTRGAGLVAATRFEEQQPTWVVSGTDEAGLGNAARLLAERTLRDRYAVATDAGMVLSLPVEAR